MPPPIKKIRLKSWPPVAVSVALFGNRVIENVTDMMRSHWSRGVRGTWSNVICAFKRSDMKTSERWRGGNHVTTEAEVGVMMPGPPRARRGRKTLPWSLWRECGPETPSGLRTPIKHIPVVLRYSLCSFVAAALRNWCRYCSKNKQLCDNDFEIVDETDNSLGNRHFLSPAFPAPSPLSSECKYFQNNLHSSTKIYTRRERSSE